jgi:hypothetical protein
MKSHRLLFLSLSKIREYYGLFKSVCANFSIDNNEFKDIFSPEDGEDKIFEIWDYSSNGMIDALEFFSALILFANAEF